MHSYSLRPGSDTRASEWHSPISASGKFEKAENLQKVDLATPLAKICKPREARPKGKTREGRLVVTVAADESPRIVLTDPERGAWTATTNGANAVKFQQ